MGGLMAVEDWVWCGYAGHFIAVASCLMHMHTRVGDYRISTVGDYHPPKYVDGRWEESREAQEIGCDRLFETYVFRVSGEGKHGEGEVVEWSEIDSDSYLEAEEAERGHMAMCLKYDRVTAGLDSAGWAAS